jgi:hypothetical protein
LHTHLNPVTCKVTKREKIPFGLIRLEKMINCSVLSLAGLIGEIEMQLGLLRVINQGGLVLKDRPEDFVSKATRERMTGWFEKVGRQVAQEYEWSAVEDRINLFMKRMEKPNFSNRDLEFEIKAFKDAISDGLKNQLIYRYPIDKANVILAKKAKWEPVVSVFPQAEYDISAGVDIWALGHYTASVFHFMRVLEHGLFAIATHLSVECSIENWHTIIGRIEAEISNRQKTLRRGEDKNKKLQFLSEAAKEFTYFKDGWRNYVAHKKIVYDEHLARSAMEHVRQFMTVLAKGLPAAEGD